MHSEARHHTKCARLRLVNKQLALCGSSRIIIIAVVIIIIVIVILRLFLCARCVLPSGSGDCYLCNEEGKGVTTQGKSIQLPRQLVIRISMTPVLCAACRCVLPLEGKEPENYNSPSLCSGNLLSLLHSMLCYKIFMSLSINDYWQLSAAVAVSVALQRSRSINRNWNTSQGFPKRMPQATIAAIFPQSEGRARWAISPHYRETNGQIKKHRQKATAQEQRQRQSSIDLKRNSSEVLTANYTKLRTSRSPRAIMKLPTPLSLSPSSTPIQMRSTAMQRNPTSTLFASQARNVGEMQKCQIKF